MNMLETEIALYQSFQLDKISSEAKEAATSEVDWVDGVKRSVYRLDVLWHYIHQEFLVARTTRSMFHNLSMVARGYRSSHHTRISSQSTCHKRAHKKVTNCKNFYLHASQVAPRNSAQHIRRNYSQWAYNKTYAMPCNSVELFGFNVTIIATCHVITAQANECDEC